MKKLLIYSVFILSFNASGQNSKALSKEESTTITATKIKKVIIPPNHNSIEDDIIEACTSSRLGTYLNDPDKSGTNIRKTPNGVIITKLVRQDGNQDYLIIVTASKNGWVKIESPIQGMESDIKIPNGEAWIHGSLLAVDTRNYANEHLNLLDEPEGGKVLKVLKKQEVGLKIKDLCGKWVRVECNGVAGWIESKWLCGNPFTTCS